MYIKNKRDSSNTKVCSPSELSCKHESSCFKTAYFLYTHRCMQAKRTEITNIEKK